MIKDIYVLMSDEGDDRMTMVMNAAQAIELSDKLRAKYKSTGVNDKVAIIISRVQINNMEYPESYNA